MEVIPDEYQRLVVEEEAVAEEVAADEMADVDVEVEVVVAVDVEETVRLSME